MNRITAATYRWLHRAKRSLKEREAYLEGLFDAGMTNEQQAAVEALLFPKGVRQ